MFAIDIDGVIANSEPVLVYQLENYMKQKFNPPFPRTYDFRDGFLGLSLEDCLSNIDTALLNGVIPVYDYKRTYLALAKLQHRYEKLWFVTTRNESLWNNTVHWLNTIFGHINYNLEMVNHDGDKESVMLNYGLDIIVEDRLKTVNDIKSSHIQAYLINRPWNVGREIKGHVIRVNDLLEAVNHHLGEPDV